MSSQKTPSTSTTSKAAYSISPLEHVERLLNNPRIFPKMYFGPGVIATEKREFWHGELWQDSPLFGEYELKTNCGGK
jgi:hypothetical protein